MTFPARTPWGPAFCLVAIVLVGAGLRGWQVTESLWLDELHTSWVVADGAGAVAQRARAGNQSPLYFWLVWSVTRLCGHTEWALRLLSLVSGIGLVVAVAWLVWRWSGAVGSCLLAAVLLALNRDCIFYAQEARPYALVQFSAVFHAAIFVVMLKRPTRTNRLVFVGGAAWLFYLHYTTFLFLLAEGASALILWRFRRRDIAYRRPQAAFDALLIVFLFLPALPHLLEIADRRENWERIVQAWPPPFALRVAVVLLGAIPAVAVVLAGLFHGSSRLRRVDAVPTAWTACWFLIPILLAWLSTAGQLAALCMVRYLVASVVGAIVFAALCHARLYPFQGNEARSVREAPGAWRSHSRRKLSEMFLRTHNNKTTQIGCHPGRFGRGTPVLLRAVKMFSWLWQGGYINRRWWLGTLACILIAGTLFINGIVRQICRDGRVIGDRNEAWDRATAWLQTQLQHTPAPLFMCAGLMEDRALGEDADAELVEYCLFPLSGIYRVRASHLEPLPTTEGVGLTPSQQRLVRRHQGMWLIIRAAPRTTRGIVSSLHEQLHREGMRLLVQQKRHFGGLVVLRLGQSDRAAGSGALSRVKIRRAAPTVSPPTGQDCDSGGGTHHPWN
ncbi:MAG: glycosyltransferase family 39 protein [Planctomycetota bacterium]